jgi:hypothetical protein
MYFFLFIWFLSSVLDLALSNQNVLITSLVSLNLINNNNNIFNRDIINIQPNLEIALMPNSFGNNNLFGGYGDSSNSKPEILRHCFVLYAVVYNTIFIKMLFDTVKLFNNPQSFFLHFGYKLLSVDFKFISSSVVNYNEYCSYITNLSLWDSCKLVRNPVSANTCFERYLTLYRYDFSFIFTARSDVPQLDVLSAVISYI